MINLFEVKELSANVGHWAKPVIAEVDENGCWKIVSHQPNSDGYVQFGRKRKHIKAHRLAYEIFVGEIPAGLWVLHRCDFRPCVNPAHLFLGTDQDNSDDKIRKGRSRHPRGVENGRAKLDDDKVREVRILVKQFSQRKVARMLSMSRRAIQSIINGRNWSHVE